MVSGGSPRTGGTPGNAAGGAPAGGAPAARAPGRPNDEIHRPFVIASLLFAVLGGFTLAVSLPFEALLGSPGTSWVAHAQVHGHLQVIGFGGLFVVGMALRLMPRFGERRVPSHGWAVKPALWLLVAGLLLRAIGQPLAEEPVFGGLMVAGALAEAGGALLFLLIVAGTLSGGLRSLQPSAVLLTAAALGLVVQACLGAWWFIDLATEERALLETARTRVLLHLQFFGFLLPAILGVGVRSFPTFFGRVPPGRGAGLAVAALTLGGVVIWTAGNLALSNDAGAPWGWAVLGQGLTGAGILGGIVTFGPWRRASRLATASKGLAWSIHPALLWLAVTGVLLAATSLRAAVEGEPVSGITLDAVRHVFGVGVVTLAIAGMAQLILPEFASERLVRSPGTWRGPAFGAALSIAAAFRGIVLLAGVEGTARWWSMAIAGLLGWAAVALLGWLFWRASRSHRSYVERISRYRQQAITLASER